MRDELVGLLEKADLALASVSGVMGEQAQAPLIEAVERVRTRLAYPEDVVVVALAGGTGSGKSSLFNALSQADLVDVGGIRPTTSEPAAAVPVAAGSSIDGYLDTLAIEERHTHLGPKICLLDLPDTDSVEVDHRHRVDSLLPLVDVIVWVTDPEKYRDARLHEDYLKPMSEYSAQFLFVINQIDRLTESELDEVRKDLLVALEQDRIEAAHVIATAAAPPSGPPIGVDALGASLEAKRADRASLYAKLLTDLAATCRSLQSAAGRGLDFDERAGSAVDDAATALAAGDTRSAISAMTGLLDAMEEESGGLTAEKLAVLAAETPAHLRRIEGELSAAPEPKSWWRRLLGSQSADRSSGVVEARELISQAIVRPARAVLARRAVAVASVAELALEVESLRQKTGR